MRNKHLDRYVVEFVRRHNTRDKDTTDQMASAGMVWKAKIKVHRLDSVR